MAQVICPALDNEAGTPLFEGTKQECIEFADTLNIPTIIQSK